MIEGMNGFTPDPDFLRKVDTNLAADPAWAEAPELLSAWEERARKAKREWFTDAPPRRDWLLRDLRREKHDGVFPLGKVGQIVAEGGAGKTMLLMQLALAVASGTEWLGCLSVPRAGRVLAILGEEDEEEVRRRLYNAGRSTGAPEIDEKDLVILPLAGMPCSMLETMDGNPIDSPFLLWLRDYVVRCGPWSLIVVDPLSRFAGTDAEKDSAAGTRFIQSLESIAKLTCASVLCAHHTNKAARSGGTVGTVAARGSSALTDGVRWVATLQSEKLPDAPEKLKDVVTLSFTKSNYSRMADPIVLGRDLTFGGALVPLGHEDVEELEKVRSGMDPAARRSERNQEAAIARARMVEEAVLAKEARRRQGEAARRSEEEAAVLAAIEKVPGIGLRELRIAVAAALGGCRNTATELAVARLGDRIVTERGKQNRIFHYVAPRQPT